MRVHGDPARYENTVRRAVRSLDTALPVWQARAYSDSLMRSLAQERFRAGLVGIFAIVALLLCAVGLYGLLSYMVGQRSSEFGLRMALGAQPGHVLRFVLRRGIAFAVIGSLLGVILAVALTRLLSGLLFGVGPTDALTYAVTILILLAVALAASFLPAWRASRLDPIQTLRQL
jgi:ABC-type antimicrobial peptide transport system permease subunit